MQTGRRASDWLSRTAADASADGRSGCERRTNDRRAPRRRFDPLFAATLVNQIAAPEAPCGLGYANTAPHVRNGVLVNLRA